MASVVEVVVAVRVSVAVVVDVLVARKELQALVATFASRPGALSSEAYAEHCGSAAGAAGVGSLLKSSRGDAAAAASSVRW